MCLRAVCALLPFLLTSLGDLELSVLSFQPVRRVPETKRETIQMRHFPYKGSVPMTTSI